MDCVDRLGFIQMPSHVKRIHPVSRRSNGLKALVVNRKPEGMIMELGSPDSVANKLKFS